MASRSRAWWGAGRRPEPPVDPGLQAERTALAWQRTALGVGAVAALLLHHTGGRRLAVVAGALGVLVALGLLLAAERRYARMVHRVQVGRPVTSRLLVRVVAAVTVLMAVAALLVVVLDVG